MGLPANVKLITNRTARLPGDYKAQTGGRCPPRTSSVGEMNKLESRYAAELHYLHCAGKIAGWLFGAVKLRLAKRTWYTPDFTVLRVDGGMEFYEVKGFWRDDARVKIKVAAETFRGWFHFFAVTYHKDEGWQKEHF
jgi:hypothetical protein